MNKERNGSFIYNVTIRVDQEIHEAWVDWMKKDHIPKVMDTGCFTHYQFVRLLEIDETDGPTYAVQYYAAAKDQYERYVETYAPVLRREISDAWGDRFIAFRSLMQVVN